MKKRTKIILSVIAVLVIVCIAVIAFMVTSDLKQEKKLNEELNSLYSLLDSYPYDYDSLDKQFATIVTTNDYAKVEKAVKDYSRDFIGYMKQLENLLNNETIVSALKIENIKEDGPDFTKTKQELNEAKTSLETISTKFSNFLTEEVAMSYIKDMELDEHYTNLYKKYVLGSSLAEMEASKDGVLGSLDTIKNLIETEEEAANFLAENKASWKVENDQLLFYSTSLSKQYNDIIAKINQN